MISAKPNQFSHHEGGSEMFSWQAPQTIT